MKSTIKFLLKSITLVTLVGADLSQAFCIYNKLEGDGASFYAYNVISDIGKSFKKEITQGNKECCPYDNGDCNPSLQRDYPLDLYFRFGFDRVSPFVTNIQYTVPCEGGAGLTITGSSLDNIIYICSTASGATLAGHLSDPSHI